MDKNTKKLNQPVFSVVISAYNQVNLLPKVLKGWEDQKYTGGFEIFVCDDKSSDGTKEWAENYAKTTSLQFKYLRIKNRVGLGSLSKNINQALPFLRGKHTLFSMGDSVPQDNTLEEYTKHLGKNRVLCGMRKNVNEKLEFLFIDWRFKNKKESQNAEIISVTDKAPWAAITGNGLLVPTWALKKVGGWSEEYSGWGNDDYDLALRLYELGLKFYLTPRAILLHIEHSRGGGASPNHELFQSKLRDHKSRVRKGIKTIVLDFDDFSPLNNGLFYLKKLKEHFPKMKVSLFTIPFNAVGQNKSKVEHWPHYEDLVKEINSLDWLEILPHGFFHVEREFESFSYKQTVLSLRAIEEHFNKLEFNFAKIFKAPFWQIGKESMNALRDLGYALAIRSESKLKIPKGLKTYKFNWGIQFPIPMGKTELRGHGHIWRWAGTGLSENFANLLDLPVNANWKWISEIVKENYDSKKK